MKVGARASVTNVLVLYIFGISLALYPPLASFAAPFIAISFATILFIVSYRVFYSNYPIKRSTLFPITGLLFVVYVIWIFVATLFGNNMTYALQDSQGFLVYLAAPPLYVFIKSNHLQQHFAKFLLNLCIFLSVISVGIIVWYYLSFGEVESESLFVMNAVLKSYNLTWQIEHNNGFLGLYTFTGHLLLIGCGLSFYAYVLTRRAIHLGLILLFAFGMFADGHRALMISFLILVVMMAPLIKKLIGLERALTLLFALTVVALVASVLSFDWLVERFSFTEDDPSTLERFLQVPALLEKITERPLMGSGFGSFARMLRSQERPFSYEMDFLATWMKLGLVGCALYFGAYLYMLNRARVAGGVTGYILFSVGLSFFFYMGTNGNSAMSTDSAVFHMFLFVLIALALDDAAVLERRAPLHKPHGEAHLLPNTQ